MSFGTDNSEVTWAPKQHPPLLPVADLRGAVIDGINVDGSSLVQETNANSYYQSPSVSADGNTLVVTRRSAAIHGADKWYQGGDRRYERCKRHHPRMADLRPSVLCRRSAEQQHGDARCHCHRMLPTSERSPLVCRPRVSRSGSTDGRPPAAWLPTRATCRSRPDVTTKKGDLNYLGKYSGSGTTWNGGTQPNADCIVGSRLQDSWWCPGVGHAAQDSHAQGSCLGGYGDSYSSGHNQLADEPGCPTNDDLPYWSQYNCLISGGAPHVTAQDSTFSWVNTAVIGFNQSKNVPSAWAIQKNIVAISESPRRLLTHKTTRWPVCSIWNYESWNVVSVTGGANDSS